VNPDGWFPHSIATRRDRPVPSTAERSHPLTTRFRKPTMTPTGVPSPTSASAGDRASDRGRIVLVGAGHAHLEVVRQVDRLRAAGLHVTLIAPPDFRYSGLISPVAAGLLPADDNHIDVAALAAHHVVEHLPTTVVDVDPTARTVVTATGERIDYSALSLNIGSVSGTAGIAVDDTTHLTKPLVSLLALRERLPALEGRAASIAVVGGGATAVELAACLSARLPDARITIYGRGDGPVASLPLGARRRAVRRLRERGVMLRMPTTVVAIDAGVVHHTDDGAGAPTARTQRHDVVVLAAGLVPPGLVTDTSLGDADGIPTRATLQHRDHDEVFAVGDCSHFLPRPLPRLGVFAVRAAPLLVDGLLAIHTPGATLPRFEPQRRALQVLELGHGRGLGVRGRGWSEGRAALALKRGIDRRWMARYRPS
jgi:NADH dehydrogenase FAD-containing subunit